MSTSYYTDPAQNFFLQLSRNQAEKDQLYFEGLANDPGLVSNLVNYSTAYLTGSTELALALAQGGIPAGDPLADFAVSEELAQRANMGTIENPGGGWWDDLTGVLDEWVTNPVQGAVRWGFASWDAAYQMLAGGAPIRARQLAQETPGMDFGQAWSEQDPYFFEALGGLFAGEQVNLGSGWFPNSDVTDTVSAQVNQKMSDLEVETQSLGANERYRTRLEASPGIWRDAIRDDSAEQAKLGKPLTQLHDAQAESVMFEINDIYGVKRYTPWSPGRIATAHLVEPGTEPFRYLSGFADFASQIVLDPVDRFGLKWAKAGRQGRRVWAEGRKVADEVQLALPPSTVRPALPAGDQTRVLAGDMGAKTQAALPTRGTPYMEGTTTPWWLSPSESLNRVASAFDPPSWYVDHVKSVRRGAVEGASTKRVRARAGVYEIDMPRIAGQKQLKVRIQRVGKGRNKYWEAIMPDGTRASKPSADPRFDAATTRFKTLDEATEVANNAINPTFDEASKIHGMTVDEFLNSAEDFGVDDPLSLVGRAENSRKPAGKLHRTKHSKTKKAKGKLGNARVRVYGKSIDLTAGVTDDLPQGLVDALKRDRKVRGNRIVGFGDPKMDKFDNTLRWMEQNGYGKMQWDDDTVLFADRFIGGSGESADPLARMWFDAGDQPMYKYDAGLETLDAPTPDQMDEIIEFIVTDGGRAVEPGVVRGGGAVGEGFQIPGVPSPHPQVPGQATDVFDPKLVEMRKVAERVKEANLEDTPMGTLPGVRNDVVAGTTLHGDKVGKFLDKLEATTRVAGQSDIRNLDKLLSFFGKQGIEVPATLRTAIFEARSKDEISKILSDWMVRGESPEFLLPGGGQYGRIAGGRLVVESQLEKIGFAPRPIPGSPSLIEQGLGKVAGREVRVRMEDQHWFSRRLSQSISGKDVNMVENPSKAYELVLDSLPHYNISRGAKIARFDPKTGERLEGTIDIEEILEGLRTLRPNNKPEAYALNGRLNEAFFSSLVEDGVAPSLASEVSRWFKENADMAVYDATNFGKAHLTSGAGDVTMVSGELLGGLGPQLSADLWSGALSIVDPRTLKRAANESDKLGRISNFISSKKKVLREAGDDRVAGVIFEDRVATLVATTTMNKIWKPFVLLRGAWTLRILIDDQFRMLADGYSMFNHPLRIFNYALMQPKDMVTAFRKGTVDIHGVKFSLKDIDEMMHADLFTKAMMTRPDPKVGKGALGYRQHIPIQKGHPRYVEGLVFEMQHLRGSTVTKVLANSKADNPVEETVRWLQGRGAQGMPDPAAELANLAELYDDIPETVEKILSGDRGTLTDVVQRQWAILNERLGGNVVLDNGKGQHLDFSHLARVDEVDASNKAQFIVLQRADKELMDVVGGQSSKWFKTNEKGRAVELEKLLNKHVNATDSRFPPAVRGPRNIQETGATEGLASMLDKGVSRLYEYFMSIPSNKLSRSPEFARAYWERMTEFFPYMDEALRTKVLAQAPIAQKKALRAASKTAKGIDVEYITDLDQLDMHAKAFALTRVEQTLFNLVDSKRNISDSLTIIFPFAEAWGEFLTRWGRLMVTGDTNIANARRFQQAVEGARGSGIFTENEYGQEVFQYPAFLTKASVKLHNALNNIPGLGGVLGGDVSDEVAGAIKATGSVESLNFASGVIPGFGPVFQMGVKQFVPEDPSNDWIRELVSPFGTSGGLANQFSPAWVKRILSAHGAVDDPALTYTMNSTRMDVMRTMIDRGDFAGVTSQSELNDLLAKVDDEAKGLMMVRAAATWWNPASPSYTFQKEDINGMQFSFSGLGAAFRELEDELGDESAAFDEFYRRFGFLPQAFRGGKTYSILDRSLTVQGERFQRSNSALFNEYPATAMYIDPTIAGESEYSHAAMLQQLERGNREQWTPEQFAYLQQDQLGDLWYDNANKIAAAMPSAESKAFLLAVSEEIRSKYPLWNAQQIPGTVQGATNDQQMAEIQRMLSDPDLAGSPALIAARRYEALRDEITVEIIKAGASSIDGPKSLTTDAGRIATYGRNELRTLAEELTLQYPEFGPLFQYVYSWEVNVSKDAIEPVIIDAFGEGDIMSDLGVAG